jgi:hypothetical protein
MLMKRRLIILATVVLAVVALTLGSTSSASATGTACAQHLVGRICTTVYGAGARVDSVSVSREKWNINWPFICNYSADISVLDGRNPARVKYFAHPTHAGCTRGAIAVLGVAVHRTFACGDIVSARWYDDDGASGYANKRLC